MTTNVADQIREDRRPGEMMALSAEFERLRRALAVAEKWVEAALEGEGTGHLAATAEYTRDQLEEELSRTAFETEVLGRMREMREGREVEEVEGDLSVGTTER
jgi:capsule polysaccharide export protein KpsE/RkpR